MTESPALSPALANIITDIIEPNAITVDQDAMFPRAAIDALGKAGLLGLLNAKEVGGMGEGLRGAASVIEPVARACASTAMVLCMHYCAALLIERHGPLSLRKEIARGEHLTTLAFSEQGSRSHFWAPLSTATEVDGGVRLDANKSWSTSAGQANSYVWSSRPLKAEGPSTLWLVPSQSPGLYVTAPFDGLGLRGNSSSPIKAEGVIVPKEAMLGPDGGGGDIMNNEVLPSFQTLSAACCLGLMEATTQKTIAHIRKTQLSHLGQSLADLPTIRAYLARMRIQTDMVRALLDDTLTALEKGRPDAMLRVLEIKAASGEAATMVTDLAMRVSGGAAFRKEVGIERHFRDARAATIMSPTTDLLYDFIGRALCDMPLV